MRYGGGRHGPGQGSRLAREWRGRVPSGHGRRAGEGREAEPAHGHRPEASSGAEPDASGTAPGMGAVEVPRRSRLTRYLPPSVFPADRDGLVASAKADGAPDDVLAELRRLPPERPYRTVIAVWVALGHGTGEGSARP